MAIDTQDREACRAYLTDTAARMRANAEDPSHFATVDPRIIADHCERVLRTLDCAPDGARFQLAPMQDKAGVPCGTAWNENVGPGQALRAARAKRGLLPYAEGPIYADGRTA
jgi:hypothetical protein